MKGLLPLSALALSGLLLVGCQDNSREVEQLQKDLVAQQKSLDEASDRWETDREKLHAEIKQLNDLLSKLGKDDPAAGPVADRIKALESRVAGTEEQLKEGSAGGAAGGEGTTDAALAAKVEALDKRVVGVEESVEGVKADVEEVRDGVVETKETKDFNEAMGRLDISEGEKEQIRQHIIDAKTQILETLEVPDADGRVYAEELIDMFIKMQNGDAKMTDVHALYIELSTKKIPGDIEDRTYAQAIEAIKAENREDLSRILTEEDQEKLSTAQKDWTEFEIGDGDPFGELYMERIQKYNEENDGE